MGLSRNSLFIDKDGDAENEIRGKITRHQIGANSCLLGSDLCRSPNPEGLDTNLAE